MKSYRTTLITALFGALTLGLAMPAMADHGGHGGHGHGPHGGPGYYGPPGHAWGHYKHHEHWRERPAYYYGPSAVVVASPVVAPRPVYYEPAYYPVPVRRSPSVVIGVDIPLR